MTSRYHGNKISGSQQEGVFATATAYGTLRNETKRNEMVLCETVLYEMVLCEMVLCETVLCETLNFSRWRPNPEN